MSSFFTKLRSFFGGSKGNDHILDGPHMYRDPKRDGYGNGYRKAPPIADAERKCPDCGAEGQSGKFCEECGYKLPEG